MDVDYLMQMVRIGCFDRPCYGGVDIELVESLLPPFGQMPDDFEKFWPLLDG